MKKKIFTLMMLAVTGVMGAWAENEGTTLIDFPNSKTGITANTPDKAVETTVNGYSVYQLKNGYTNSNAGVNVQLDTDGGFKAGDIVTVAGFINNSDESKYGAVTLFTAASYDATSTTTINAFENFANLANSEEITEQSYTLEADYDVLYLGRNGNTNTNITAIKVVRPSASTDEDDEPGDSEGDKPENETETVILSWNEAPTKSNLITDGVQLAEPTDDNQNPNTGENLATWNNGYSILIMRADKSQSNGENLTIDGTSYKTIKVSNGAQNKLILPEGKVTKKITLYSYINTNSEPTNSYWKEVAGKTYTIEETPLKAYIVNKVHQGVDKYEFTFDATNEVTFTNSGTQACYVLAVEVEDAPKATTIKLNAEGYATYSNSYDVEVSGAKAYTATLNLSAETITCTEIASNQIPAGEGVLLFGEPNAEVTLTPIEAAAELGVNDLKATTGADNKLADKPETCYVLSGKTFMKYTGDTFAPNKAYLDGNDVAGARSLNITFGDDDTTGIKVITNAQNSKAEYFDLQGRRVAQPTKGLYIIDGKKVIIK